MVNVLKGKTVVKGSPYGGRMFRQLQYRQYPAQFGKVGATAGWTVPVAADSSYANLPASQTSATLIIPITGLKPNDKITGFHLLGSLNSSGGTATIAATLHKQVPAAGATPTDTTIGTLNTVSKTAAAALDSTNTLVEGLTEVISYPADATYYVKVVGTTAASTAIALQGVVLEVTES